MNSVIVHYCSEAITCQLKVTPQLKQNEEWSWAYHVPFINFLLNKDFEGKLLLKKCPQLFSFFLLRHTGSLYASETSVAASRIILLKVFALL